MHDRQFEGGELEVPLSETQELELASELLEVSSEQELEQFLGDVFHVVGNALGQFVHSDTGQALGGILKDAAKKALPVVGRAIGERVAPGQGGEWGGQLAQAAGATLGLELEGLSPQDQEFEAARQFVRLAGAAAHQALLEPPGSSPEESARYAAAAAAERFAPGLAHEIGYGRRRPMQRGYGYGARTGAGGHYPSPRRPTGPGRGYIRGASFGTRYGRPAGSRSGQWRPGASEYGQGRRAPVQVRAGLSGRSYGAGSPRPWQPGLQRPWQQGWQQPWQPGSQQPWQQSWQQPWQQGWQGRWQPGHRSDRYGAQPSDAGGWSSGAQSWGGQAYASGAAPTTQVEGSVDWSKPLHFYGQTPPHAPAGAPGRWVYRGIHRRRRLWSWVPFPGSSQFWSSVPASYATAPPADAGEPEPVAPAPNGAAPPAPGPTPTFEPAPPATAAVVPAAPGNGANPPNAGAQPDPGGQAMAPSPGDQSQQNGTAPAAPPGP
jgi:hypothetical protein